MLSVIGADFSTNLNHAFLCFQPNGIVLFRDYATGDLAQVLFWIPFLFLVSAFSLMHFLSHIYFLHDTWEYYRFVIFFLCILVKFHLEYHLLVCFYCGIFWWKVRWFCAYLFMSPSPKKGTDKYLNSFSLPMIEVTSSAHPLLCLPSLHK